MKKSLRTLLSCTVRGYRGRAGKFSCLFVSYFSSTVLQFLRQTAIYPLTDRQARLIYHECECPRYSIEQAVWVSEFRSLIGWWVSIGGDTTVCEGVDITIQAVSDLQARKGCVPVQLSVFLASPLSIREKCASAHGTALVSNVEPFG